MKAILLPLVLSTGRQLEHWHTGARIVVTIRRGAIELKSRADNDVPDGMIFIPFCYAEAAANTFTNAALDPVGKIPEFKFCAARVEAV